MIQKMRDNKLTQLRMKNKILRITAIFLSINFLTTTLAPTLTFALTAGATAPEYTSFEPVDTTDIVNLATGDLAYNIPLLEVPGPEGGYPLSLSYHAGITPDEEASWVGLGWTLNAGAVNRSIQGYPDDVFNAPRTVHDYWPGGETDIFTIGVGYAMFAVDVNIANDTYKGNAVGIGLSAGYQYELGDANVGISANLSSGVYGEGPTLGLDAFVGVGMKGTGNTGYIGANIGISTNFKSVSMDAGVGVGVGNASILGASISSNDLTPSLSVGGYNSTSINNNNAGKISSQSNAFSMTMPLPYGFTLTLGQQSMRYWSDERDELNMYGSLYANNSTGNASNSSVDSYILPELEYNSESADQQKGGSFPAYDLYSVLGQGIGGSIQPYSLHNTNLYRQHTTQNSQNIVQFVNTSTNDPNRQVNFRFKNDFSNKYLITRGDFPTDAVDNNTVGIPSETYEYDSRYYNPANNKLAGSRHIEWVTNNDIQSGNFRLKSSFIPYEGENYGNHPVNVNGQTVYSQIGGFVVTNESGVSYHYALPVYAYGEYTKITTVDGSYKENFNDQPYAYTWLLTAVTGPDYIDRGAYGITDEDLGYWVKFSYGKWSDKFQYRTPLIGTNKDLDQSYNIYTSGSKELYYLDYIRTRSHTAFFEKEIRLDGKGVSNAELGGSYLSLSTNSVPLNYCNVNGSDVLYLPIVYPTSTLRLKSVYLFDNTTLGAMLSSNSISLANLPSRGVPIFETATYTGNCKFCQLPPEIGCYDPVQTTHTVDFHQHYSSVIDAEDLKNLDGFDKSILRKINFNHDYSLCPQTANSFQNNESIYQVFPAAIWSPNIPYNGKLTLNSIEYGGKGGVSIMPPTTFHYNNAGTDGTYPDINTDTQNNPAYDVNKKDIWGNYKPDVDASLLQTNENLARSVTDLSASRGDVWSLKEIVTPIGAKIKIDYESDDYSDIVLGNFNTMPITGLEVQSDGVHVKVYIKNDYNQSLSDLFSAYIGTNKPLRLIGAFRFLSDVNNINNHDLCQSDQNQGIEQMYDWEQFNNNFVVTSVGSNYIMTYLAYPGFIDSDQDNSLSSKQLGLAARVGGMENNFVKTCNCTVHAGYTTGVEYTFSNNGQLVAGDVFFEKSISNKGGGIRVKTVSTITNDHIYSTNYQYSNGVTSYLPGGYMNSFIHEQDYSTHDRVTWDRQEDASNQYKSNIASFYKNILSYARELPGPGVIYANVSVSESIQNLNSNTTIVKPGYKEYKFRTFNLNNGTSDVEKISTLSGDRNNEVIYKDFTSRVGNIISTTDYKYSGNSSTPDSKIEETIYQYLEDDNSPTAIPGTLIANSNYESLIDNNYGKQGHIEELFNEFRLVGSSNSELFVYSKRIEYPSVLKKITTKNYKTGISTTSENLAFDFVTGNPTKVLTKDALGNRFITETIPAYTVDAYSTGMGIAIFNDYENGTRISKNMLSQTAANTIYKADASNNPIGLVSSQVQTWKGDGYANQTGLTTTLWRPHRSFMWTGTENLQQDGTHDWTTYVNDPFGAWSSTLDPGIGSYWEKVGEITLYSDYSRPLEVMDINGRYTSNLMSPAQDLTIASGQNVRSTQFGHSGAEFYTSSILTEGNVNIGNGIITNDFAHTGAASLLVASGQKGFNITIPNSVIESGRKYRASAWVYMPGFSEDDKSQIKLVAIVGGIQTFVSPVLAQKAGSWYLLNLTVTPDGMNDIVLECRNQDASRSVYFDDFRYHPLDASISSYVYDRGTKQLLAILNSDNFYTRFVYDAAGRLNRTYAESFGLTERKLTSTKYNYGKKN
jgi:hypothetical protein